MDLCETPYTGTLSFSILYLVFHGDYIQNVETGTTYNTNEKASVDPVKVLG